jgi:YfiH family protein
MTLAQRLATAGLDWIVPDWRASQNVHGLVTTRNAGAAFARSSFDLGPARLDALDDGTRASIAAHRAFLGAFLPAPPVWLEQVHGHDVATIDRTTLDAARAAPPVADAAVTRLADVPLAIRVADCLPVFLADDAGRVIAAAHAGWRGLAAGVLEATVGAMAVEPASLSAWLGPAIGASAFEVGEDVVEAFVGDDFEAMHCFAPLRAGKWAADLAALARRRLAGRGVTRVHGGEHCTWSDAMRFPSWRRDRTPQRMAAVLWRTAPPR